MDERSGFARAAAASESPCLTKSAQWQLLLLLAPLPSRKYNDLDDENKEAERLAGRCEAG